MPRGVDGHLLVWSGLSVVFSIWISSIYVLIPILLFSQTQTPQTYGGYMCHTTDQSVTLYWFGENPRRILDFIDIMFRIMLPIFFMLILLPLGFYNVRKASQDSLFNRSSNNVALTPPPPPICPSRNERQSLAKSMRQAWRPGLKDSLAVCNDAFDNDDNLRTINACFIYLIKFFYYGSDSDRIK